MSRTLRCPCCGADAPELELPHLDMTTLTVIFRGETAKLSPTQAVIFAQLLSFRPTHYDTIYDQLYCETPECDQPSDDRVVITHISVIRRAISSLGLTIDGAVWGTKTYQLRILQDGEEPYHRKTRPPKRPKTYRPFPMNGV